MKKGLMTLRKAEEAVEEVAHVTEETGRRLAEAGQEATIKRASQEAKDLLKMAFKLSKQGQKTLLKAVKR